MNFLTRYLFPNTGNSRKAVQDMQAIWWEGRSTSPGGMDRARARLEQYVDFHESAGRQPPEVASLVIQCAAAMPDSPRRQAFVRQTAFQPVRGSLGTAEGALTARTPRLEQVGQHISERREALSRQAAASSTLPPPERECLLREAIVWCGRHSEIAAQAHRAVIHDLLQREDWAVAFTETCNFMSHGGTVGADDPIVAFTPRMIAQGGALLDPDQQTVVTWGLARAILEVLVHDAAADRATLQEVRELTRTLDAQLQGGGALNPAAAMAMAQPDDPALADAAAFVERLRDSDPGVFRLAEAQLRLARTVGDTTAAVARSWLANLERLQRAREPVLPTATTSDAQRAARIAEVRVELNNVAYGHQGAKNHILGLVGVRLQNPAARGSLLALQGPHGNGKTTLLTRGLAPALGVSAQVIDMAGMQDTRQLLGHLPVYVGAEPGKLTEALMGLGRRDGVIVFDEIEKASREVQDMVANLVDASRNAAFETTYFSGIPIDLSRMVFAFTLNDRSRLSPTLAARLAEAMVATEPLSEAAKVNIANLFLIPAALQEVNRPDITFDQDAILCVIREFTREEGARQLRGHIFSLARDFNLAIMEGCVSRAITVESVRASNSEAPAAAGQPSRAAAPLAASPRPAVPR